MEAANLEHHDDEDYALVGPGDVAPDDIVSPASLDESGQGEGEMGEGDPLSEVVGSSPEGAAAVEPTNDAILVESDQEATPEPRPRPLKS